MLLIRRVSARPSRRLVVLAGLAATTLAGIGAVLLTAPAATVTRPPGQEGTIRLAPDAAKLCQRLGFDNRTGAFRNQGLVPCEAETDTAVDRMQAVRAWFNRNK